MDTVNNTHNSEDEFKLEVLELMESTGLSEEVVSAMVTSRLFLERREGKTIADLPDDIDYYISTELQVVGKVPSMEIINVTQPDGTVKKVRQQKTTETGELVTKNKQGAALLHIGQPELSGHTWEQVQAAALDLFAVSITGLLYQGMKKKGYSFNPGEFISIGALMRYFDASSLDEVVALLAPRYKAKLNESDKQRLALQACTFSDGSGDASPTTAWINDKMFNNLKITLTHGNVKPLSNTAEAKLKRVSTFAATFATTMQMKGAKPNVDDFGKWKKLLDATGIRLTKGAARLRAEIELAGEATEKQATGLQRYVIALEAIESMQCVSGKLQAALIQLAAKAAAKAEANAKTTVEVDAPDMDEDLYV